MEKSKRRAAIYGAVGLVIVAILAMALLPDPPLVDGTAVGRGPMQVSVDEKGETRVRDRFAVTAPVSGELHRIGLREGTEVEQGDLLARIEPLPLDSRQSSEMSARIEAAAAALEESRSLAARAESSLSLATSERKRIESLAREGIISEEALDRARSSERTARQELEAARSRVVAAAAELEAARARVLTLGPGQNERSIDVRAPVGGEILRIPERSARVVAAGELLMELSDAEDIEIVIEMLSTDAVKVRPGNAVIIEDWGGDRPLRGTVRLVEPSGFTKVSALGIEEQRVRVIADIDDPPPSLRDGYRVETSVVIWESVDVLQVPISALFRKGNRWAVFVVSDGRAIVREVEIGRQNDGQAEVLSGLEEGEIVILHPANELSDGAEVELRPE